MKTNNINFKGVATPSYIMEEDKLRNNLSLIKNIMDKTGVEIILAFKAFALWKSFPIFREYISHTTASSPFEARLAFDEFGSRAHTYSPAYEERTFGEIMKCSSHITFNSITQFERFFPEVKEKNRTSLNSKRRISCGIRINPEYSEIETDLYNPCAPGTRFGVTSDLLPAVLPEGIEGFHCHCHCESSSFALEHTLQHIEEKFGPWLDKIKWLNLGGGHLVTRKGYDVEHLIKILNELRSRHPNLHIVLEPGSAFAWQTGVLVSDVVDIVDSKGIKTAILNVSFTCHMPDCLEMPYTPVVRGAEIVEENQERESNVYRLGGNSCLSGDFMGYWKFNAPLNIGDKIIFEDMIHYTTVKTTMFNGAGHPSISILHSDGELEVYREFVYEDYRDRMC